MIRTLLVSTLLALVACDATSRVEPLPDDPTASGDIGTTLPNDPLEPVDVVDTDEVTDTDGPITGSSTSLALGTSFSCTTFADGELACWGLNTQGQAAAQAGTWSQVVAGASHACALSTAGTVSCWGDGSSNKTQAPSGTFARLVAGPTATCALDDAGAPTCWGGGFATPDALTVVDDLALGASFGCAIVEGESGVQCFGEGPAVSEAPNTGTFTALAAGSNHVCALSSAVSSVTCWGSDTVGQASPPAGGDFVRLSAGVATTCGVRQGGALECWGSDTAGQASPPGAVGFTLVAVGQNHGCGVRNGEPVCWGDDLHFQSTPPLAEIAQVEVSLGDHACARDVRGSVRCFGDDADNKLEAPGGTFTKVATGTSHTCGLTSAGTLACWGDNSRGQLNVSADADFLDVAAGQVASCAIRDSTGAVACYSDSTFAPREGDHVRLDVGDFHGCAVQDPSGVGPLAGTLTCWGASADGQRLVPDGLRFTDVATGFKFTCGLVDDGSIDCFGLDTVGETDGAAGTNFVALSAGKTHACGLRSTGAITCWGDDSVGAASAPPGNFVHVSAGDGVTCAVTSDGDVRCWGRKAM